MLRAGYSEGTGVNVLATEPRSSADSPISGSGHVQASVLGALLAAEREVPSPDGLVGESVAATDLGERFVQDEDVADDGGAARGFRSAIEWILVVACAVLVSVLVRQFLFQAFYIESRSMEATLEVNDRVLVNRLSYKWGDVGRGDVVVFSRLPEDPGVTRDLIKRVIGLPGEEVEGRASAIYIDGVRLNEPYLVAENMDFADFQPVIVPAGELFVMGDNRDDSLDSRRFGTVDVDRAAGRAFMTFWPLQRASSL